MGTVMQWHTDFHGLDTDTHGFLKPCGFFVGDLKISRALSIQ
jgi:hypothetical protein